MINFETISSFQATVKPYISSVQPQSQVEPQNATEATAAPQLSTESALASPEVFESIMTSADNQVLRGRRQRRQPVNFPMWKLIQAGEICMCLEV